MISLLTKIFTGMAVTSSILSISPALEASSNKYHCREVDGIYGVYSRNERGDISLLSFTRDVSESWSIEQRCEEVATRFQRYYDNDILRFIGAGEANNEPVLCAIATREESCSAKNILVTLPPKTNPVNAARQLMNTRGLARGRVIQVSGKTGKIERTVNGNTSYDLQLLEEIILSEENSDRLIEIE